MLNSIPALKLLKLFESIWLEGMICFPKLFFFSKQTKIPKIKNLFLERKLNRTLKLEFADSNLRPLNF